MIIRIALLAMVGLWLSPAFAETADEKTARLEATVEALTLRVTALEKAVITLSRLVPSAAAATGAAPAPAKDAKAYLYLRKGMTMAEVEKLLGTPTSTSGSGPLTYWHYGSASYSAPRVTFADDSGVYGWENWGP